jgi:isoleucyl-tRNA synthetase
LAPILSFTADELWSYIPGKRGDNVMLETWYCFPEFNEEVRFDGAFWEQVLELRMMVSKQLEMLRVAGEIGSSLDAEVDLYCGTELHDQLTRLRDELRFVLITSYARVYKDTDKPATVSHHKLSNGDEFWLSVRASAHPKCVRCWHHREDVGDHADHPEICGRCVENVEAEGESRRFA